MADIKVIIADDHTLVRAGIKSLLESINGVEVIGEADNGRVALKLIEQNQPDIVLLDIAMSELNGLDTAARVSKEFPDVKIMILSMHASEEYVLQALRAGASGYLLKESAPTELELALRAVARGETYLSPVISRHVVEDYLRRVGSSASSDKAVEPFPHEHLTPRQREILQLIAEGNSTKEIAGKLNLSVKTVETHRMQMMERLNIRDVAGLVRYAIRTGIISSDV
ncbi:MAG: response regulator transcription factor [Bacteroidota bacterium]|nr:response regulator transcription factor [Bacteroidota bacterium]